MRIGSALVLLALGAILAFAIDDIIPNVDLSMVGYILMGVGVIGLVWALLASQRSRVTESRTVQDPNTGETIQRSESHDGL